MQKYKQLFLGFLFYIFSASLIFSQTDIAALDTYFEKARTDWDIPGMAIGIIKDGEIVMAKGYGLLEAEKNKKVDEHTLFAIASNTKAFISTSIGMLVEEGKLDWDDPVQKHLPFFELYDPWVSENITIRDLLCHRSGLGTFSGDVLWYRRNQSAEDAVKKAKTLEPAFAFRSGYGYSNLMFLTAGEVIKAVSGKSWDQFVKDRILNPLGMNRTQTSVEPLSKIKNVASPHKPVKGENIPIPYVNWDNMGAAGGVVSSASDMLNWMNLQLNGGRFMDWEIFDPATQVEFWTPHNNFKVKATTHENYRNRNFSAYALGWSISDFQGKRIIYHGGGYDGMYSKVSLMPEENLGIVILTNSMKGISTQLTYKIFDAFLELDEKDWSQEGLERQLRFDKYRENRVQKRKASRKQDTQPAIPVEKFAGLYRCESYGDIEVEINDGKLSIHFSDAPELDASLNHWHFNVFELKWKEIQAWFDFGTVQFMMNNMLEVESLKFDVPNDDIFFEEIKAKKVKG